MLIDILSLCPNIAAAPLGESILGRAQERGLLTIRHHNLRDWATDKHRTTDDTPYGGSPGMVMKCEPIFVAVEELRTAESRVILMSPAGQPFTQRVAEELVKVPHLILLCGHYEGVDQRVIDGWIDEQISIGDYVLTGGEIPAMVLIDSVVRRIPGVLGKEASGDLDSFSEAFGGKREYPQYTRPEEFRGMRVPDVLLSGNHQKIEEWRAGRLF